MEKRLLCGTARNDARCAAGEGVFVASRAPRVHSRHRWFDLRCCYAAYTPPSLHEDVRLSRRRSLLIVYCVKVNKGEVLVDVEQRVISSLYYSKSVRVSF